MNINQLPTPEHVSGFYPTPITFALKILEDIKWDHLEYILEPSAGKGDLVEAIQQKARIGRYSRREIQVDCVEIDPNLRAILTGKGYRVIHNDFLTFNTQTQYDLIVMNPPFREGSKHLLKAMELIRPGGCVICILNAETIRNPYTNERKRLVADLERIGAVIEYHEEVFDTAERPTLVEVAVVRAILPEKERESVILEHLRKAHVDPWDETKENSDELITGDLGAIIDLYNFQATAGKKFLADYLGIKRYFTDSTTEGASPIIKVEVNDRELWNPNDYLKTLRMKFWKALFSREDFNAQLTSNVRNDLYHRINEFGDYEFSWFNIKQLQQQLSAQVVTGIQETILNQFDEWSQYALYDGSQNVHYYNGWKTNEAHKIGKKIILPFYNHVWGGYNNRYQPSDYSVVGDLSDIEKVFDYLNGRPAGSSMIHYSLREAEETGQTRKIQFRYFHVSFFKKRTIHIVFTDEDALYRFNLYAARQKQWLPPTYGARHYSQMDEEEQAVVDQFEGEESYERMLENANAYLHMDRLGLPMPLTEDEDVLGEDTMDEDVVDGQLSFFAEEAV